MKFVKLPNDKIQKLTTNAIALFLQSLMFNDKCLMYNKDWLIMQNIFLR